jgi:hypothetical protein
MFVIGTVSKLTIFLFITMITLSAKLKVPLVSFNGAEGEPDVNRLLANAHAQCTLHVMYVSLNFHRYRSFCRQIIRPLRQPPHTASRRQ